MITVPANDLSVPAVAGGTVIDLVNGGAETQGTYYLIGYGAGGADPYADLTIGTLPGGFTYSLVDDTGNNSIDLTATVPEPASAGVLAVGALGLLARRRRARSL
jgi:hypothetical protein